MTDLTNVFNRIAALSDWNLRMSLDETEALRQWILTRYLPYSQPKARAAISNSAKQPPARRRMRHG